MCCVSTSKWSVCARANIDEALQNRGSCNITLKAFLYWMRRQLQAPRTTHKLDEYKEIQNALNRVFFAASCESVGHHVHPVLYALYVRVIHKVFSQYMSEVFDLRGSPKRITSNDFGRITYPCTNS